MKKAFPVRRFLFFLALLLPLLSPAIGRGEKAPQTTLIIAGSGTTLPIVRVLAAAFTKQHPEVTIEVPASIGSTSGIRAVADDAIAIGMISRPLKEEEKGLGLEVVPFASTPMIIAVHPSVAEANITSAELVDIYRGKKTRWANNKEIIVLTRESGDSTITELQKKIPGFSEVYAESQRTQRWATLFKDLTMNETLAKTPDAIGFSDLGAMTIEQHRIKALKVNNVAPTLENVTAGKYPLVKPLIFVYHRDKILPAAQEFLSFVRSPAGAKIMLANGYLPEK